MNHVWACAFLTDRMHDGRALRLLTIVGEFTRKCLAIIVARTLTPDDVLATLTDLCITRGCQAHLRSDNGPEFFAKGTRKRIPWLDVRTFFIEPGTSWRTRTSKRCWRTAVSLRTGRRAWATTVPSVR
jgi:transposase InsO family protein